MVSDLDWASISLENWSVGFIESKSKPHPTRLSLIACGQNTGQVTEERKKGSAIVSGIWRCNAIIGAVNGVTYSVPERLTAALSVCGLWSEQRLVRTEMDNWPQTQDERNRAPYTHSGYIRDEQPSRLPGHPQAQGQADDQIQDQQQKIRQPSMRQENNASA